MVCSCSQFIWGAGVSRSRLGIGLLFLALALLLGLELDDEHEKRARREQERLTSLAAALNVNIAEQLRASSRMLDTLSQDIPGLLGEKDGGLRLNQRMHLLTEALTGVRTLLLVNASGEVVSSNRPELLGQSFLDSDRYKTMRGSSDVSMLFVSKPFTTPLGAYTVSLGKILVNKRGEFDGYLLAVVDPVYFSILFRSLIYAPDMRLSVVHGDGTVFYSTQETPDIRGTSLVKNAESVFNRHMKSGLRAGFYIDRATTTGDVRFIAIQTVWPSAGKADKPLVVAVSREEAAIFHSWKISAWLKVALFGGLIVVVVIGQAVLSRRKRAYQQLHSEKLAVAQAAEEKVRESNAQFRAYFDNMAVGAAQLDASGFYVLVNDRYCEMTGYSREEMVGRMKPFDLTHPDDVVKETAQMREFLSSEGKNLELEKRMIRKDGEVIWFMVSAHAARDPDGKMKFVTAVIQDISLRKRMVAELEEARDAAEVANRAKTLFLGNMSHEMRTPLHQISGIASLFRRDPLNDKQRHRLDLLEQAVKRMDTVIGGILSLVDLESKSTTVQIRLMDVQSIIANALKMLRESAETKGLQLELRIETLPLDLLGDERHFKTILMCFGNNAIAYTEKGKISIRVSCDSEDAESAMIRVEVQDEGMGIAPENQARLFEHFEQADNSNTRRFGGTGVGLAIVKRLAKLMGGDAGCRSVLGEGSTFWATMKVNKANRVSGE